MSLFEMWTTMKQLPNGRWEISCNKGLWLVESPNKNQATAEAIHYFMQYLGDGEYQ